MLIGRITLIVFASAALFLASPAHAAKIFKGPVEARIVEIIDGDTFLAEALVWPGHQVRVNIRIRGIDAPEMKAHCPSERAAALSAREALASLLGSEPVSISNIAGAKYYGRVLADVTTPSGEAVASLLLERRLVRAYAGGKRDGWCD